MSRSLLHDWEYAIEKCCRENNQTGMIDIAEDIYNTAYVRGKNHSVKVKEALEQESKADKALNLLAEWAIECGFGYDNIPEEYEKYKDDISEMGYREGLVYIVKMESEAKQ